MSSDHNKINCRPLVLPPLQVYRCTVRPAYRQAPIWSQNVHLYQILCARARVLSLSRASMQKKWMINNRPSFNRSLTSWVQQEIVSLHGNHIRSSQSAGLPGQQQQQQPTVAAAEVSPAEQLQQRPIFCSSSNSPHYGRLTNSVSWQRGSPPTTGDRQAMQRKRSDSCSNSNSGICSSSSSCSSRSVVSSWSRNHNVQLASNNCLNVGLIA